MDESRSGKQKQALSAAESRFKRKEEVAREGAKAMAEYEAQAQATRDRMVELRELRLAKEAADEKAAKQAKAALARKKAATVKKKAAAAAKKTAAAAKKAAAKAKAAVEKKKAPAKKKPAKKSK